MSIKNLYEKYAVIPYLFFGVCTTLVNVAVYWVTAHLMLLSVMPSTLIAWFLAVLFAYFTNRKWVFHSTVTGSRAVFQEMLSFFVCRFATGVVDWLCMFIFVDLLAWHDVIVKLAANVLVIILNYIASRLVIFKKS